MGGGPIVAERLGKRGGRRVLVIGVIHGDEDAGVAIVDELRQGDVPDGVELWLVESMNPDGQIAQDRHNANGVDLNRNFPSKWDVIGVPGDGQYAGSGPASERKTKRSPTHRLAAAGHGHLVPPGPVRDRPRAGRDGRIRARYAELTGLPMGGIAGGIYTGVAATWARNELHSEESVAFIVELGRILSDDEAQTHTAAVRTSPKRPDRAHWCTLTTSAFGPQVVVHP